MIETVLGRPTTQYTIVTSLLYRPVHGPDSVWITVHPAPHFGSIGGLTADGTGAGAASVLVSMCPPGPVNPLLCGRIRGQSQILSWLASGPLPSPLDLRVAPYFGLVARIYGQQKRPILICHQIPPSVRGLTAHGHEVIRRHRRIRLSHGRLSLLAPRGIGTVGLSFCILRCRNAATPSLA